MPLLTGRIIFLSLHIHTQYTHEVTHTCTHTHTMHTAHAHLQCTEQLVTTHTDERMLQLKWKHQKMQGIMVCQLKMTLFLCDSPPIINSATPTRRLKGFLLQQNPKLASCSQTQTVSCSRFHHAPPIIMPI